MQYPPIKTIEAVLRRQVDYRARRSATHFRHFFRCLDKDGLVTDNEDEVVSVELTQRCKQYYDDFRSKQRGPQTETAGAAETASGQRDDRPDAAERAAAALG